jgi:hypothetical protein
VVSDAKGDKPALLERMCYGERLDELAVTLRMVMEMDPVNFEDIIIYPIAQSAVTLIADRPLPSLAVSPSDVRRRRAVLFGGRAFVTVWSRRGAAETQTIDGYPFIHRYSLERCLADFHITPASWLLGALPIPEIFDPPVRDGMQMDELLQEFRRRYPKNAVVEIDEAPDAWFNAPAWFDLVTTAFRTWLSGVSLDACRDVIKRVETRRASRTTSRLLEGL